MFLELKTQFKGKIIFKAIEKAGTYRKLSKLLNIPRSSLLRYAQGDIIPEERFNSILKFLEIRGGERFIIKKLPSNWKQIIGGRKCVEAKKKKGTFKHDMGVLQEIQSQKLKKWHKFMKKNKPKEYYLIQYSRFKKIGNYKFVTKRGEKVRNILEKEIADVLYNLGVDYKYEPLVKASNRYFFPDFLVENRIIIECTMWRGFDKAYKLRDKIRSFKKRYRVFVVVPKSLNNYYFLIKENLILGLDEFVPVAQTFKHLVRKEQQVEHLTVKTSEF